MARSLLRAADSPPRSCDNRQEIDEWGRQYEMRLGIERGLGEFALIRSAEMCQNRVVRVLRVTDGITEMVVFVAENK